MTTPTAPDQVVRLLATDGYDVHRLIYEAFVTAGGRDFLYAPFAVVGGFHAVFVRRFDVQTHFAAGMQFAMTLRAMPAVKANGRRRSIGAARAKDALRLRWIEARARERGFTLLASPEMRVERVRLEAAKTPFAFNACIYRVPIRVTDAVRFTRAYTHGIGQGIPFRPPSVEDEAERRFLEAVGLAASRIDGLIVRDRGAAVRRNLAQGLGRGLRGPEERCTVWLLDPRFPLPKSMTRVIGGPDQGLAAKHLELIHCIPARFRNGPRPAVDRGRIWPLARDT